MMRGLLVSRMANITTKNIRDGYWVFGISISYHQFIIIVKVWKVHKEDIGNQDYQRKWDDQDMPSDFN